MSDSFHLCVITVNHNTSHFVELMLRTVFLTNDLTTMRYTVVVLDNQSDDVHAEDLRRYLADQQVRIIQTGFDTTIAAEKHGVALAHFIGDHPNYTHYLFLDADMWFMEPETIPTMMTELVSAPPTTFAVQARIQGYYAGRVIEGHDGSAGSVDQQPHDTITMDGRVYRQIIMPRCSPVCSLVANTTLFRQVVDTIGLAPARRLGVGIVYFYDTFSLMTEVMRTHAHHVRISAKTINHFTQVTYMPEHREGKDRDCWMLLDDLRAGRGMQRANFFESDWVRRQRQQP